MATSTCSTIFDPWNLLLPENGRKMTIRKIIYHTPGKADNEIALRCSILHRGGRGETDWAMQNVGVLGLGDIFCSLIAFETKKERVTAYISQLGFSVKIIKNNII